MVFDTHDIATLRILVDRTCTALEKQKVDREDEIPLAEAYRFLEQYRYDAFNWRDAHIGESAIARHMRECAQTEVRAGMHRAGTEIFPELSNEAVAVRIETALCAHALGKSVNLADAKRFFAAWQSELKKQPST